MFAKFNLCLREDMLSESDFYSVGLRFYTEQKETVHFCLDKYLAPDGSLDGEAIVEDWFPSVQANVFLSHSHKDEKSVLRLAGFLLQNYGITSFIDSTVWGYMNDLLKMIDDRYCIQNVKPNGGHIYNYEKRNQSTSHIHLMLQGAIAKMINQCECLIFVNTPHSLNTKDIGDENATSSPWIYNELLMANTFPARCLQDYKILGEYRADSLEHYDLSIKYRVKTNDLLDISLNDFQSAAGKAAPMNARKVLDNIYLEKGLIVSDTICG